MKITFSLQQHSLLLMVGLLTLPLSLSAISETELNQLADNRDETYLYCDRDHSKMAEVIAEISKLDEDKNSLVWQLNEHIQRGFSIGRQDAIMEALECAAKCLDKNYKNLKHNKFELMEANLNSVMNAVADGSLTVDAQSLINDESVRGSTVIFKNKVKFKNKAKFEHFVRFEGNVKFDKNLSAADSFIECDLTVGCNISMNDSVSSEIGNIIKNGVPFIHNYPGIEANNTFVGDNAGNFTVTGGNNVGFGTNALLNNADQYNVAVGSGALQNYVNGGGGGVAVGYNASHANFDGGGNTAVGYSALAADITCYEGDNSAFGWGALSANISGTDNTALGNEAMEGNTLGFENTAAGSYALWSNTEGDSNAAFGYAALTYNITGYQNTAVGDSALYNNSTGYNNTAMGNDTLFYNTIGVANTAIGQSAMQRNEVGSYNTALGNDALYANITGGNNTALGQAALTQLTGGNNNIAVGDSAGNTFTSTESNNIDIGNVGVVGESGIIRIGTTSTHTAAYVQGIYTSGITGVPVEVNITGQLGVASSSAQFKRNIKNMDLNSEDIYRLRPVTFEYKNDDANAMQYGLIAEEVANVFPSLVVHDKDGSPYTVRYQVLPMLLLNEVQKHQASIEDLIERVAQLEQNAPAA